MLKLKINIFEQYVTEYKFKSTADTKGLEDAYNQLEKFETLLNKVMSTTLVMRPSMDFSKVKPELTEAQRLVQGMFAGVDLKQFENVWSKINAKSLVSGMLGSEDSNKIKAMMEDISNNVFNDKIKEEAHDLVQGMFQNVDLSQLKEQLETIDMRGRAGDLVQGMFGSEDIEKFKSAWNEATNSAKNNVQSFGDKIKDVVNGAKNKFNELKDTFKSTGEKLSNTFKSILSPLGIATSIGGLTAQMKKAVVDAGNYEESVNLFKMALRDFTDDGKEWATEISDKLYLDDKEVLQYTGSFYNLTKGLGATKDAAYLMAKNLTQLTYDMSSYLNIDVSAANTKLMSAMSGQTKAVTSVGIAVQQASLQELAHSMGIKKSVREMTQAEKTYLRYIQIMKSTKNMQGDLARTIVTPTNAFRMLSTQVTLLARAIGKVLTPFVYNAMPPLIALTRLLTNAAKGIADFFGYDLQEIDYTNIGDMADAIGDLGDESEEAAKKTNRMLAPFDELNVVENDRQKSGSGSDNSVLKDLEKQLKGYDMLEDLNEKMASSIDYWEDKLKSLSTVLGTIAGVIATFKIANWVSNLLNMNKQIGETNSLLSKAQWFLTGIITAVGSIKLSGDTVAQVREAGDAFTTLYSKWEWWLGSLGSVAGGAIAGGSVGGTVGALLGALAGAVGTITTQLINGLGPVSNYKSEYSRLREETDKLTTSLNDNRQAIIDNRDAKLDKTGLAKQYLDELDTIVDKNGKIKEGYEERAKFLTGQLNDAYHTHMEVQDGRIKKLDEERQAIRKTIEAEEAKIYLDAQQELYAQAIKNRAKLESQIYTYKTKINAETKKQNKLEERNKKIQEEIDKLYASGNIKDHATEIMKLRSELGLNNAELTRSEIAMTGLETELGNLTNEYETSSKEIDKYQKMAVANSEGNYKKVYEIANHYTGQTAEAVRSSLESQMRMVEPGSPLTTDIVGGYMHLATLSKDEYTNSLSKLAPETALELDRVIQTLDTSSLADHFGKLSKTSETEFLRYLRNYPADVQTEIVDKMKEKGYKISENLQKGIDQVKLEAKINLKEIKNADVQKWLGALMKGITLPNGFSFKINSDGTFGIRNKLLHIDTFKANGGYVDKGDVFVANEAGPEYITSIGNKSAVVNQGQMVAALSNAIITATGNRAENQPQQIIVQIGNDKVYQGQGDYQNRQNDRYGTTVVKI
jgi:hypothetical protein